MTIEEGNEIKRRLSEKTGCEVHILETPNKSEPPDYSSTTFQFTTPFVERGLYSEGQRIIDFFNLFK